MKKIKNLIESRLSDLYSKENTEKYFCMTDCYKDFCGCHRRWNKQIQNNKDDLFKYEKLCEFKLKFGKYKGNSYMDVAEKDPSYFRWLYNSYSLPKKTLLYKLLEFMQPYIFTIHDYIEKYNIEIDKYYDIKYGNRVGTISISEVLTDFKVHIIISYQGDSANSGNFFLKNNKLFCNDLETIIDLNKRILYSYEEQNDPNIINI